MTSFWVWGVAFALYVLFRGWYDNWRGRLSVEEAADVVSRMVANNPDVAEHNDLENMRRFLAEDDGREFFMLNIVRLASADVKDPLTGEARPAKAIMEGYTKTYLPALFARAGHPAIAARKIGGYFDAWGVEADPGWTMIGYMRYRSRRDLAQLVCDPRFGDAHAFKFAAMPQTFSFPTRPAIMTLASPRTWVTLSIALAAALAQVAWLLLIANPR